MHAEHLQTNGHQSIALAVEQPEAVCEEAARGRTNDQPVTSLRVSLRESKHNLGIQGGKPAVPFFKVLRSPRGVPTDGDHQPTDQAFTALDPHMQTMYSNRPI